MRRADADAIKGISTSLLHGLEVQAEAIKTLAKRITTLEAENKELRSLWIEHETCEIENATRIDHLYEYLSGLNYPYPRKKIGGNRE